MREAKPSRRDEANKATGYRLQAADDRYQVAGKKKELSGFSQ
jgi:hypothetical protein